MPWKPGHKAETRERIVAAAAAAMRKKGFAGIGVADIMAEAGLTHGGFYAHFASKDELIAEALQYALKQSPLRKRTDGQEGETDAGLLEIAERYLSPSHARHPERGCPLAALGEEWARAEGPARPALNHAIGDLRDWLARRAPGTGDATQEWQATGALAAMVGGIILGRGLQRPDAADRLLADVRRFVAEALKPERGAKPGFRSPAA